jgi:hypothetical protein
MPVKLYQRSKLVQTASASNGSPSWKVTPSRRLNTHSRPSSLVVHSSASAGTISVPPSSVVTRPSKMDRTTRRDSPSLT